MPFVATSCLRADRCFSLLAPRHVIGRSLLKLLVNHIEVSMWFAYNAFPSGDMREDRQDGT